MLVTYSFAHRRARAADRCVRDWIRIISAGLYNSGTSYKDFVHGLSKNNISLDRKVMAEIAQTHPADFAEIVTAAAK